MKKRKLYARDLSPTIPTKPTIFGVGKVYRAVSRIRMYMLTDGGLDAATIEPETLMLLIHKNYARGTKPNHDTIYARYKFLVDDRVYMVKVPCLGPARQNIRCWFVPVTTSETYSENE